MEELENPIDDPNQPTVTEELLQIIEEFADYIDKFMFEIVTFLAVVDSSMGLIKDVLGMFGFSGWKMTFFPSFSFVVTVGVFLFGTKKRKGKRNAEAAQLEGLGEAMEMIDDVFEAVDDVMDEIEEVEGEPGTLGLGDYSDSEGDDDDDDDDENTVGKAEISAGDETSVNDDAGGTTDVVSDENTQEASAQQDAKNETEPPTSTLRKAIGIAIIAARIASKLAKKKQAQEEGQQLENADDLDGKSGCATDNEIGDESLAGTNEPPTDDKSKQGKDTCNKSETGGFTLGEDELELKKEAAELVEAVKEDGIKAADLVKEGSLGASNLVQDSTNQVLKSTGALKVGHGLYREADFITRHLNKEGKAAAESLEKETIEKSQRLRDNSVVKATGVEKVGTGVSREAAFIATHLNQETKKALHYEEGKNGLKSDSRDLGSDKTEGKEGRRSGHQGKEEGNSKIQSSKKVSPTENTRRLGQTKGKINKVSTTDASKQNKAEERKGAEVKLSKKEELAYAGPSESVHKDSQSAPDIRSTSEEKVFIEGEKKGAERKQKSAPEDPKQLTREPLPGTPDIMASNIMEGSPGAAGATAASQAKQGLQQTQKKSKGLLQIVMRLVRLIMRVVNKRSNSAASSQNSSRRGSTASGGSLGGPAKGKRSSSGGGAQDWDAADMAGAAASMAMGSSGVKGGKIGAIVGIVVRLVRLASKLKACGQQEPTDSDMRKSDASIDRESDSEPFYDCGEEFPTQEIQTQTDNRLSLSSVATQTTQSDPGSMWNILTRDSADITDMRYSHAFRAAGGQNKDSSGGNEVKKQDDVGRSSNKESTSPTHMFSTTAGQSYDFSTDQTRQPGDIEREGNNKERDQTLLSREQTVTNLEGHKDDDRGGTMRRNSTSSLQRITLKILSPDVDHQNTGGKTSDLNSILLDIDAPVVLHARRELRSSGNDMNNTVASGNNIETNERPNSNTEEKRTEQRDVLRNEFSLRKDQLRASSNDLDELEKQFPWRGSYTDRRDSIESIYEASGDSGLYSHGLIVPYSSSSEDLDETAPFVSRRRPTVVRFEDECDLTHAYDEDQPIASYRQKKKYIINRDKKEKRRAIEIKTNSSLEKLDDRFSDEWERDDESAVVPDSGSAHRTSYGSTRLVSNNENRENQMIQSRSISAARKSRLSGSRSSYLGDDESDQPGALC